MVAEAHTQDFEKKRRPAQGDSEHTKGRKMGETGSDGEEEAGGSSDEDDDDDPEVGLDAEVLLRHRSRAHEEDGEV